MSHGYGKKCDTGREFGELVDVGNAQQQDILNVIQRSLIQLDVRNISDPNIRHLFWATAEYTEFSRLRVI